MRENDKVIDATARLFWLMVIMMVISGAFVFLDKLIRTAGL